MPLDEYMKALAIEWGINDSFATEVPGVFEVSLEENLFFSLSIYNLSGVYLSCNVAPIPKESLDKFFTDALYGNLFGEATKNSVLGLNEQGDVLTLSRVIDYDVSLSEFKEIIEDFISAIDFWRSKSVSA